ncbi:hypothetical protein BMW23_0615 [Bodo saltans virus]|uniref:Uncharacterized protein n=1 Tax=Bodo saltans virus TaxID=2024608 RepID=A0A2H4UUQ3_9VIRU|nr:hypothetical protein QJ851_gp0598 [Bodo saltans virus]ATZ80661.1 hypothetical protein BMW23_0615 [Bodo saltans virus]
MFHCTSFSAAEKILESCKIKTHIEMNSNVNIYPGVYFAINGVYTSTHEDVIFVAGLELLNLKNYHINTCAIFGYIFNNTLFPFETNVNTLQALTNKLPEIVFHNGIDLHLIRGIVIRDTRKREYFTNKYKNFTFYKSIHDVFLSNQPVDISNYNTEFFAYIPVNNKFRIYLNEINPQLNIIYPPTHINERYNYYEVTEDEFKKIFFEKFNCDYTKFIYKVIY